MEATRRNFCVPSFKGSLSLLLVLAFLNACSSTVTAFAPPKISFWRASFPATNKPWSLHHATVQSPHLMVMHSQRSGDDASSTTTTSNSLSSPLDNPALATLDMVALLGFAAIGKASHAADGSIDVGAVLVTAFPFLTAWFVTSPLTGVYRELETTTLPKDVAKEALVQAITGWAVAIPLGCALRGIIKGYVPPIPFVIVTLVATLVILGAVRVVYSIATIDSSQE